MGRWKQIVGFLVVSIAVFGLLSADVAAQDENTPESAHAELLKKAGDIAKEVAVIRGLRIKRPIQRGVMTKAQIRKRIVERMDQEYSPAELAAEELAMKRMGLLTPNSDYKKIVIDLLTDQIAGFYDPWERRLYIAGWQQPGLAGAEDAVMAHEIDHALQDQHFNLRRFMKPNKTNGDSLAARQALVEGDGMALMVEHAAGGTISPWSNPLALKMLQQGVATSMSVSKVLRNAPLVLREGLVFPYIGGLGFVVHFRKKHRWKRIDRIYRDPPQSSEQILHPKKYVQRERPDQIKTGKLRVLAGYSKVYDNVSGEIGLSILLRQHGIAKDKAARAADGWGGDRLAVYTAPEKTGLDGSVGVQYTVWDADADTAEYFDAIVDAIGSLSGGTSVKQDDTYVEYATTAGTVFAAEKKGDAVVLIVGAPADKAAELRAQVWKSWRVRRR